MKTIETWCGTRATLDDMPSVLRGWRSYAKRLERQLHRLRSPKMKQHSLEFQLCEILTCKAGEHGDPNGSGELPVDVLCRIIHERDQALKILALDRLKAFPR
jgi:hypothetical protein